MHVQRLPAASVPLRDLSVSPGSSTAVLPAEPSPSPITPAALYPTEHSWSSSHPWEVQHSPLSRPPRLCHQQHPLGWPCHQTRCHHRLGCMARVALQGVGVFWGNTHLSQMLLSTPYVFSCLPSTPHISTTGLQSPCSGSICSQGLGECCAAPFASSSPPCLFPRASALFQWWVARHAQFCPHTHPMGLHPGGVAPAPVLFCPAPACT